MEERFALVTGAAGGIGAAVARTLGERGTTVAAVDRDARRLQEVTRKMTADGLAAEAFAADVTDRAEVDRVVASVEDRMGPLDYLVNAAGVLRHGEARHLSDEDWADTFAVNTTGVFLTSRAVVERMVSRSYGAVVTVASNAATTARAEMSAYAASKAAAAAFTKCLGLEVAKYGIRCNVVAPGTTDTPMLDSLYHDDGAASQAIEGHLPTYRAGIPLGRLAQPADIAHAVAFLLSDGAAHITMHSLTVDGGAALGV